MINRQGVLLSCALPLLSGCATQRDFLRHKEIDERVVEVTSQAMVALQNQITRGEKNLKELADRVTRLEYIKRESDADGMEDLSAESQQSVDAALCRSGYSLACESANGKTNRYAAAGKRAAAKTSAEFSKKMADDAEFDRLLDEVQRDLDKKLKPRVKAQAHCDKSGPGCHP